MIGLRQRWRAGRPEFVILVGASIGVVANVVSIVYRLTGGGVAAWPTATALFAAGALLSILAAIILKKRRARTPRNFVYVAATATALAVLSFAGLIGGGVALAGATWGVIETYASRA